MIEVVGLGPGDPDLVTVAAVKRLRGAEVVYVPVSTSSERGLAERIVRTYTEAEVRRIPFKMGHTDAETLRRAARELSSAGDVVYAQLGDPALYGTFAKLRQYLSTSFRYVPGVTSVTACALYAGRELVSGDGAVAVVPATRQELLGLALSHFDVVVVVKANKNIDIINAALRRRGGIAVKRCYMDDATISQEITWNDYFTTAYIWGGGR
jgi:precorrin-2/cobalt-factor-2 C20-methyltransferase|nr:MAG: cobalt-precorrin-2 C(20)-methyltransferase [Thermoproteus sp. AZ2]